MCCNLIRYRCKHIIYHIYTHEKLYIYIIYVYIYDVCIYICVCAHTERAFVIINFSKYFPFEWQEIQFCMNEA